jgi:hypothetical protein
MHMSKVGKVTRDAVDSQVMQLAKIVLIIISSYSCIFITRR